MKSYDIIISSVKIKLKFNSKDHVMGYIHALVDWRVISLETYERLKIFVEKGKT